MFDYTPNEDMRLPSCPLCAVHPMRADSELWKCLECGHTLLPDVRDPVWPWESYEEARERWLKKFFG